MVSGIIYLKFYLLIIIPLLIFGLMQESLLSGSAYLYILQIAEIDNIEITGYYLITRYYEIFDVMDTFFFSDQVFAINLF